MSTDMQESTTEITTEIPVVTEESTQDSPVAGSTAAPVIGSETAPISLAEHSKQFAERARQHWTPPNVWEQPRPPLKATWLFARYGEHLPDDETVRKASRVTAGLRLPFKALFLTLDWVFDRDSRVVAAALLVLAVIQALWAPFF